MTTSTSTTTTTTSEPAGRSGDTGDGTDSWLEAGEAWSHAPTDWACLYEHYASEVLSAIHQRMGVGTGVELLDVACGAGMAVRHARGAGADVYGIDAAAALVEIARERNPGVDIRLGSMFSLPWKTGPSTSSRRSTASGAGARARWSRPTECCGPAA